MPQITFLPDNITVEVPFGTTIMAAAASQDIHINASCGWKGTCGKCQVIVKSGNYKATPSSYISEEAQKSGTTLACATTVTCGLVVEIPAESQLGIHTIPANEKMDAWKTELDPKKGLTPLAVTTTLSLPPPTINDNISDMARVLRQLSAAGFDTKNTAVRFDLVRKMAATLRQDHWKVTVTSTESGCHREIVDIDPGADPKQQFGVAIDIGTTSVSLYLINLKTGQVAAASSAYNSQTSCGEDIISRIVYAQETPQGLQKLHQFIQKTINRLLSVVTRKSGVEAHNINCAVVAGNTTMMHLFLKISPRHIREEPYIPTFNYIPDIYAGELGIRIRRSARIFCMPCVASYIGGDITSGVLSSGIYKSEKLSLFIDIGTNGEIILGNKDWLVGASCSAGPAFEGGGVLCGMRATPGAIEQVRIDPKSFEVSCQVICDRRPIGICGSGIIDLVAELFLCGLINQKGRLNKNLGSSRVRSGENGTEFVVAWASQTHNDKDIVFTEADIDNIIRTKGAIFAGFSILLREMGLCFADVEQVIIAGGFGSYLNIDRAILIGMLPDIPQDRFVYVGNSSIAGAHLALLSHEMRAKAVEIASNITYMELSVSHNYMEEYVSALFLPHTDGSLFPTVAARVEQMQS